MPKRTDEEIIYDLIKVQRQCYGPGYMAGLLNGLIVAHNCITKTNQFPAYCDGKLSKNKVRHKLSKSVRRLR